MSQKPPSLNDDVHHRSLFPFLLAQVSPKTRILTSVDWIGIIFAVIIGVFVGGVAITVGNRARLERLSAAEAERQAAEARAQKAEVDLATANGRLENLNKAEEEIQNKERRIQDLVSEVTGFQVRLKELETQMEAERRSFEERTRQLDEAEQKLKDAFNALFCIIRYRYFD